MALTIPPLYWLALVCAAALLVLLAWRKRLRWKPAYILRLLVIGAALWGTFTPGSSLQPQAEEAPREAWVLDFSDSVDENTHAELLALASARQKTNPNTILVAVGSQADLFRSAEPVNGRATSLDAGINKAVDLLGPVAGKITLFSDGTSSDSTAVIRALYRLRSAGHQLEIRSLALRSSNGDAFLTPLQVPALVWAGTPFYALYSVQNSTAAGTLEVKLNGEILESQPQSLAGGFSSLLIPGLNAGSNTLEITWTEAGDPRPKNNHTYAVVRAILPPRDNALLISSQPAQLAGLKSGLESAGLQVTILPPTSLSSRLTDLDRYTLIALHNLLASELSTEQMLALNSYVTNGGGGLLFLGGRNAYTLGGYQNTPLEALLPVKLEPPKRSQRSPVVQVLVLDRSGSMSDRTADHVRLVDMVREGAMRVVEDLYPEDYLGVLAYETLYTWIVPMDTVGEGIKLRQAQDAISRIYPLNTTNMLAAMTEVVDQMTHLPPQAPSEHYMLVLSDGQSTDGEPQEFYDLAARAQESGITISTIALGEDADFTMMASIARIGGGRYYEVREARDLPRIMLTESQAARAENIQTGEFSLTSTDIQHPVLYGLSALQFPALKGYNALASKSEQGAEDVIVANIEEHDPIFSVWQVGLGRTAAWMSDMGEEWAQPWQDQQAEQVFWAQAAQYLSANPAQERIQTSITPLADGLDVHVEVTASDSNLLNLSEVTFTYAGIDGNAITYRLPQTAPGTYSLRLSLPADGAYRAVVSASTGSEGGITADAPFAVNPPLEWLPVDEQEARNNLSVWADTASARLTSGDLSVPESVSTAEPITAKPRPAILWLAGGLLLVWIIDVAARRRWLPWF